MSAPASPRHAGWVRRSAALLRLPATGLLVGLLTLMLPPFLFSSLENASYDERMILKGERVPDPRIIIVALDDRSKALYSYAERDRRVIAHVVDVLSEFGARAIAVDIAFPPARNNQAAQTAVLARSLKKAGNVFVACPLRTDEQGKVQFDRPDESIVLSAAGLGCIRVGNNEDDVIRQVKLVRGSESETLLFLSFLALGKMEGLSADTLQHIPEASVEWGRFHIPLNAQDAMYIQFAGPSGAIPRMSLVDVLDAYEARERPEKRDLLEMFRHRLVLVGATAESFKDSYWVPTYRQALSTQAVQMPGVEIQANIVNTILSADWVRRATPLQNAAAVLLLSFACALVMSLRFLPGREVSPLVEIALVALLLVGYATLAVVLLVKANLWLDMVEPLAAGCLTCCVFLGIRSERFKARLLTYVPGAYFVISEISGHTLDAHEKDVTVVFFDVENYVEMSQSKTALEVFYMLKELHGELLTAFTERGGEIITYLGDAAMITFGAFKPLPDHPAQALKACATFRQRLENLNHTRAKRGLPALTVGIGLCTGQVAVGILGHGFKEVSVTGSTVNIAARLQGESKRKECRILVNDTAFQHLKDRYRFITYENLQIKGLGQMTAHGYDGDGEAEST